MWNTPKGDALPETESMTGSPSDESIRTLLRDAHTIAVVGASPNAARPVFGVMRDLIAAGYRVLPVNPGHTGSAILGQPVVARLADIRGPIDIVNIFRRQSALAGAVDEALALDPLPKAIWMQVGLVDGAAATRAEAVGVAVVMDRCIRIEHGRLIGE